MNEEVKLSSRGSCLQFCPATGSQNLLALGTYNLDEASQTRSGEVRLYLLDERKAQPTLSLGCTTETAGAFEVCWQQLTDQPVLGVALSNGCFKCLAIDTSSSAAVLDLRESVPCFEGGAMCTSLDFGTWDNSVAVSSSTGELAALAQDTLYLQHKWQAHNAEVWSCSYHRWQAALMFSGADDCMLKGWDMRSPAGAPAFINRKSHGAGVCTIQSSPLREHLLCTGSYDEHVRLWDMRSIQQPLLTAEVSTGGGVWRLRWHPHDPSLLGCACMHQGAAVISVGGDQSTLRLGQQFSTDEQLVYGFDWCCLRAHDQVAATCSFYDERLRLWTLDGRQATVADHETVQAAE